MNKNIPKRGWIIGLGALLSSAVFVIGLLVRRYRQSLSMSPAHTRDHGLPDTLALSHIKGLSEEEAAERLIPGLDNRIRFRRSRSTKEIWRESLFTIFNFSMLGLAAVLLLLGFTLDALTTLGVMLVNIGLNVFQQTLAKKRLGQLDQQMQPRATVIRAGKVRSLDINRIVVGDMIAVGPGDQIVVDGKITGDEKITVNESMPTSTGYRKIKRPGDNVFAGSYCIQGRGVIETDKIGGDRLIGETLAKIEHSTLEYTPLQKIIKSVLLWMIAILAIFSALLLSEFYFGDNLLLPNQLKDAFSIIIGIAPSGLFFMLVVGYAVGSADIAKLGALAHHTESIEALANTNIVCFGEMTTLTGPSIQVEYYSQPEDQEDISNRLTENQINRFLGDMVHSVTICNAIDKILTNAFKGNIRQTKAVAPLISIYGWNAIAIDQNDMQGVFVLGYPDILTSYIREGYSLDPESGIAQEETEVKPAWKKAINRLNRIFVRKKDQTGQQEEVSEKEQLPETVESAIQPTDGIQGKDTSSRKIDPDHSTHKSFFSKILNPLKRANQRSESARKHSATENPDAKAKISSLVFAFHPDIIPLFSATGHPQLPLDLTPLCILDFSTDITPEAIETVKAFRDAGVRVKVLSSNRLESISETVDQLGLDKLEPLDGVSGPELPVMISDLLSQTADNSSSFTQLTPDQKGEIVQILREQGNAVSVIGDGVSDIPALMGASLSISKRDSSPVAFSISDIVLLHTSLRDLPAVLKKGQQILNGMLATLNLFLTQIIYLALLAAFAWITHIGLPYTPKQSSIIAIVAMSLPFVALSLWAPSGPTPAQVIRKKLAHFVLPAAITTAGVSLIVNLIVQKYLGDRFYAQLAVTYTLVSAGLLLVAFVQPPTKFWVGGASFSGDKRPSILALGLFITFILFAPTRLAHHFFDLYPLYRIQDYFIIGAIMLFWTFTLRFIWRALPSQPFEEGQS